MECRTGAMVLEKSLLSIATAATLTALIVLCLAWELWLAPLRAGGSLLSLKALPLVFPLFGVLREHRYTYQWSSMLVLAYFTEGLVRAISEPGLTRTLAFAEMTLSLICFCLAILFTRSSAISATRSFKPGD